MGDNGGLHSAGFPAEPLRMQSNISPQRHKGHDEDFETGLIARTVRRDRRVVVVNFSLCDLPASA
jgi:hypothetical protein